MPRSFQLESDVNHHRERAEKAEERILHLNKMEEEKKKEREAIEFRRLQQKVDWMARKRHRLVINNILSVKVENIVPTMDVSYLTFSPDQNSLGILRFSNYIRVVWAKFCIRLIVSLEYLNFSKFSVLHFTD